MKDKINGRTLEEIKKGLECCINWETGCIECPYDNLPHDECIVAMKSDNLAYIQQLERERDVAVEDIKEAAQTGSLCYICKSNNKGHCSAFDHGIFEAVVMCGQYKWRGAQEVE